MALRGARLAGIQHQHDSCEQSALAGSSPELPARPFAPQEQMYVRNGQVIQ